MPVAVKKETFSFKTVHSADEKQLFATGPLSEMKAFEI
jgi:hypothetical protein